MRLDAEWRAPVRRDPHTGLPERQFVAGFSVRPSMTVRVIAADTDLAGRSAREREAGDDV